VTASTGSMSVNAYTHCLVMNWLLRQVRGTRGAPATGDVEFP
jgi:hypothetical protein